MTKNTSSQKANLLRSILLVVACGLMAAQAWAISPAADNVLKSSPTSLPQTHASFYSHVELAKPPYTAMPTITPTLEVTKEELLPIDTSIQGNPPAATETLEVTPSSAVAVAEIVQDTPATQNDASSVQEVSTYNGNKRILVDISEQHMYAYEGDTLVFSFVASTGMNNATRTGTFSVLDKIPNAYGATWDLWMPNWLGIYWAGSLENGIHALPILSNGARLWSGYLGTPISYGCVVLGVSESQMLYDWSEVGTPVEIQW
ncbi:MAG: L,D-transpeptidase family protein [Anaerolineales bacterium]